jgi:hypothetical protein
MILAFYGSSWVILEKIIKTIKVFQKIKILNTLISLSFFGFAFYFSFLQIKAAWYQFIDIPAYVSDEAILSREAGKYFDQIFIDGDFDPAATFYAGRPVKKLSDPEIINLFKKEKSFLLITNQWRLDKANINPSLYSVIKTDRDKVLIRKFEQ